MTEPGAQTEATTQQGAYGGRGEGYAEELRQARELQKFYAKTGGPNGDIPSRAEALEMVKANRNKMAAEKVQAEAKPNFVKDGKGIRGDVKDDKNQQFDGADGRGQDLQFKGKKGSTTAVADNADQTVIACDIAGAPGIYTGPGSIQLL